MAAIGKGRFGDVKRTETGGKGLDGVLEKAPDYFNPFLEILEARMMLGSLCCWRCARGRQRPLG